MDVNAALQRVTADLAAERAALQTDQQRVLIRQGRVDELELAQRGLEYARENYDRGRSAVPSKTSESLSELVVIDPTLDTETRNMWQGYSKSDAILHAMKEIGRPAETREVVNQLRSVGRQEDQLTVKSGLNYLKRNGGKVRSVRPGLWALPDASSDDFGPAVEAGPREASDNEISDQGAIITGTFGPSQPSEAIQR